MQGCVKQFHLSSAIEWIANLIHTKAESKPEERNFGKMLWFFNASGSPNGYLAWLMFNRAVGRSEFLMGQPFKGEGFASKKIWRLGQLHIPHRPHVPSGPRSPVPTAMTDVQSVAATVLAPNQGRRRGSRRRENEIFHQIIAVLFFLQGCTSNHIQSTNMFLLVSLLGWKHKKEKFWIRIDKLRAYFPRFSWEIFL